MKKLLLTIFLIYNTAFAQVPDSVEIELQTIEQSIADIRSHLSVDEQRVTVTRKGEDIHVIFPKSEQIDVQFRRLDDSKVHSVQWLLRNWEPAPPALNPQSGEYTFEPNPEFDWEITVGAGQWKGAGFVFEWSENYVVEKYLSDEQVTPEKLDLFVGFWYDNRIPDIELKSLMTVGHAAEANVEPLKRIVDAGRKAIPYINADPDMTEFEIRRQVRQRLPGFKEVGLDNIACYNLKDEPYPKGYTKQQLEWMLDEIQKYLGENVCATYSFTRHAASSEDLPDNLKYVWVNYYPFYKEDAPDGYSQVWTYEDFAERADQFMSHIRSEIDDPKVIISPQVFGTYDGAKGPPWRAPEPITAEWYFRYAQANPEIVGFMLWKYGSDRGNHKQWFGLEEIEPVERAWVELIQEWVDLGRN